MAHVVAEPCIGCLDTRCVSVCPTDSFHQGGQMLYIHPDECIDCESCVSACPVGAIFHEDDLPRLWRPYRDLNATMARQSPTKAGKRNQFFDRCIEANEPTRQQEANKHCPTPCKECLGVWDGSRRNT